MKRFNLKNAIRTLSAAGLVIAAVCAQTSCSDLWSEQHPGTYYINSGETIASFLEEGEYKDDFTSFVYVLKKAGLWGELRTYGEYTCFAPTNEAFDEYLQRRRDEAPENRKQHFACLDSLTVSDCDTIARTHLCRNAFYCSDMYDIKGGAFPYPNMMDRYLTYSSFADTVSMTINNNDTVFKAKLAFRINQEAQILEADDTVQNGVVHIIGSVVQQSTDFLPGLMKNNPKISIFVEAIKATGLDETVLSQYMDSEYPWAQEEALKTKTFRDSTIKQYLAVRKMPLKNLIYQTGMEDEVGVFPDLRYFKFTVFAVKDSILKSKYNINNLNDLREKAKQWYPEGSDLADREEGSSLMKFLQYHILPEGLSYDKLNLTDGPGHPIVTEHRLFLKEYDVEDFYETLLPHSIMRISTPYPDEKNALGIFINRKGTIATGLDFEGIEITAPADYKNDCMNGYYHYIDDVLLYDKTTREEVLNTRMRIMANTLSPDFINSGATGRYADAGTVNAYTVGFLKGYCKNFEAINNSTEYWVRYANSTFDTFMGYEMTIRGIYDLAIQLPPVPFDGTYEIRIWINSMSSTQGMNKAGRGIVQFYFNDGTVDQFGDKDWEPCGIPVDLRIAGSDARIGNVKDDDIKNADPDNYEQNLERYEKAMRNRGYMKAMDSYKGSNDLRGSTDNNRKIVCNEYMKADGTYYLRLRQIMDDESASCPLSFIEIVPKSVYAGEGEYKEDRH